ncbi:MAG: PilW family protein [Pseudomonadales bacterium]|nr:PilW family protein [Pseudomonadales bacterium]
MKISNRTSNQSIPNADGFSLAELMIAMVIGLFLMGGVLQIAVSSKQNHVIGEDLTRLQENGRFALDVLTTDIRKAGYLGLSSNVGSVTPNVVASPAPDYPFDADNMIRGFQWDGTNWSPSTPSNTASLGTVVDDTDMVVVQYGDSCGGQLINPMTLANTPVQISAGNTCSIVAGETLVISSYTNIDVFRATTVTPPTAALANIPHGAANNTSPSLGTIYGTNSEILKAQSMTYYIRNGANGAPSLWRFNNNVAASASNPEELVEGVEDMAILYGVDNDAMGSTDYGVADRYVSATGVIAAGGWANVVTLRIALLMKTSSDILESAQDYTFLANTNPATVGAATAVTPGDLAARRTLSTTIQLRNHGLQ